MNRLIIFCIGMLSAAVSETFWKGETSRSVALWGGMSMLLLRRILIRYPFESKALLCVIGAVLLMALRLTLLILPCLPKGERRESPPKLTADLPGFSYALYRFLLIAPAYTVIEYLEARLGT